MRPEAGSLRVRAATATDAPAVAALHVLSWRATYRGSFSDAYLDGPIEAERSSFWHERLALPGTAVVTLLLEDASGGLCGFVSGLIDDDPRWGTLVNNLHVVPDLKGGGLGRRLMLAFAEALVARGLNGPVFLFALASNAAARVFYLRIGAEIVERLTSVEPDGSSLPLDRFVWPSVAALREGTA